MAKQHEAMKRALHLAERNKQLEKELRDIDQMALAVEAEANCCAKTNYEKINRYETMHVSLNLKNIITGYFAVEDKFYALS